MLKDSHYLFSHPPREAKGKLYEESFFHACFYDSMRDLRHGPEVSETVALSLEDALARKDIAFSNASAHLMLSAIDKFGITTTDWFAANLKYQLTGKLPDTLVYAPTLPSFDEPSALSAWATAQIKSITPQEQANLDKLNALSQYSKGRLGRWMRRHGLEEDYAA